MTRFVSTLLLAGIALLLTTGCQSADPISQTTTAEPSQKLYTLEECLPDLSKLPTPTDGTGTIEVFWPNGEIRYSASVENGPDGSTQIIECFTPEGKAIYSSAHEDVATPAHAQVKDVAQLRWAVANQGTIHQHEAYLISRNRYAELVIDPEYATIPLATFIADTINGVMMLDSDGPLVAEIIDRSIIRLWLPEAAFKQPNTKFSFLSEILNTSIDREILATNRHIDRPLPWPGAEKQQPQAADLPQTQNITLNTIVKSTSWGMQPAREDDEVVTGKYVCSAYITLDPTFAHQYGASHVADQLNAHFADIKTNPPRISSYSGDELVIWFPYQDHDQVAPNIPLLKAILAMNVRTTPDDLKQANKQ